MKDVQLSSHAAISSVFNVQRHLISRKTLRRFCNEALSARQAVTAATAAARPKLCAKFTRIWFDNVTKSPQVLHPGGPVGRQRTTMQLHGAVWFTL
jgi:hypothetical protein